MRAWNFFVVLVILSIIMMAVIPIFSANPGGVQNGNQEYDCGSCHSQRNNCIIGMWASDLNPEASQTITVMVNITCTEVHNTPLGIMLISKLSSENSMPSDNGWTIELDPSGVTSFNYIEEPNYETFASLSWTMIAPNENGIYSLYAQEYHGNGGADVNENATGLTFVIGGTLAPIVLIQSPSNNSANIRTIKVNCSIISEEISYVLLMIDGNLISNKSEGPFEWDVNTKNFEDGTHIINITAVDINGAVGYSEVIITIDNASIDNWIATIVVGMFAIMAFGIIMVITALFIRKKTMERGEKK